MKLLVKMEETLKRRQSGDVGVVFAWAPPAQWTRVCSPSLKPEGGCRRVAFPTDALSHKHRQGLYGARTQCAN